MLVVAFDLNMSSRVCVGSMKPSPTSRLLPSTADVWCHM